MIFIYLFNIYSLKIYRLLSYQLPGQMSYFISGAILYYYYGYFQKYKIPLIIIAVIIYSLSLFINLNPLRPMSLAIIVIFVAYCIPQLISFKKFGDISYGVYVYHFPIIQTFVFYKCISVDNSCPYLTFIAVQAEVFKFGYKFFLY